MFVNIFALVWAEDPEEALDLGRDIFDNLCQRENAFDYFKTFDDLKIKEEFGSLPVVIKADDPEGENLIAGAWEETKREFVNSLTKLREILNKNSSQALWEKEKSDLRHQARRLGEFSGETIRLYDSDANGILDQRELDHILSAPSDSPLWVVPAVAHS